MPFVQEMISTILAVFTQYVPGLATAVVDMFTGLFWGAEGGLTLLGSALISIAAIGIVSSVFYIIYRIFRGRMKRRV